MPTEDSSKFPGEAVAMGGNILPLEEQFDSRKSLQFHRGIWNHFQIKLRHNLIQIKFYYNSRPMFE